MLGSFIPSANILLVDATAISGRTRVADGGVKGPDSLVLVVTVNHLAIEISGINSGRRQNRLSNTLTTEVEVQIHWKQSSASSQLLYSLYDIHEFMSS